MRLQNIILSVCGCLALIVMAWTGAQIQRSADELSSIRVLLARMEVRLASGERVLTDHEERIRGLERK